MSAFVHGYQNQLLIFLFVLARVSGLVLATPGLNAQPAPKQVRLLLAVAIALLIAPVFWETPPPAMTQLLDLAIPLTRELVLGLVMGLVLLILVAAIRAAGQIVGQMSGMSLAQLTDPDTGTPTPLLGQLFGMLATAVFLIVGGHRQLLAALLDTFHWMPPGRVGFTSGPITTLSEVVGQSFLLALRVSAPVVLALLLSALVLGLIGRTLPQLNVLALGLGTNSMIAICTLALSLITVVWIFQQHTESALEVVTQAVEGCVPVSGEVP
jgi:flagellar biosynthetic protein FliR